VTHLLEFECLDQAVLELLGLVDEQGEEASPREMRTRELLNVCFTIADPRARLVFNEDRRWSFPLAVGEFLWHLAGRNDSSSISHFAPRWADFAVRGVVPSSCYGHKIFRSVGGRPSQWEVVVGLLRSDPSTRRAVISLYDEGDLRPEAPDIACTCTLQFFIRGGRLHLTVYMRSNDAVWGLPYDCFVFTMLQELLAHQLGYPLGQYVHFAASLHVYQRHFSKVASMLEKRREVDCSPMPSMDGVGAIDTLLTYERRIREERPLLDFDDLPTYWSDLLLVLSFYKALKLGDDLVQRQAMDRIHEPAYRRLLNASPLPVAS
jgi:thymidylate synthase